MKALPAILAAHPEARLLVAGRGDEEEAVATLPKELRERVEFLGMVSDEDKARLLRSVDVYVAPNTGGESFGIILVEALSAGAPVLASDLDAFAQVLDQGAAGDLFANEDADALAAAAIGCWATRSAGPDCASAAGPRPPLRLGDGGRRHPRGVRDGDRRRCLVGADERSGLRARFGLARD